MTKKLINLNEETDKLLSILQKEDGFNLSVLCRKAIKAEYNKRYSFRGNQYSKTGD